LGNPRCYGAHRLYSLYRGKLRVYDFRLGASREVLRIHDGGHYPSQSPPKVSPDHKRLAYFRHARGTEKPGYLEQLGGRRDQLLTVVDMESKDVLEPCAYTAYLGPLFGVESVFPSPPFTWVDPQNILFVRTHIPAENISGNTTHLNDRIKYWLATADIGTGEIKDVVAIPRTEVTFLPRDSQGTVSLAIAGYGRYRLDIKARKLIEIEDEDEEVIGQYRLCRRDRDSGRNRRRPVYSRLYHNEELIDVSRQKIHISVSPDGKRILWMTQVSDRDNRRRIRYYNSEERSVRDVCEGRYSLVFQHVLDAKNCPLSVWLSPEDRVARDEPAKLAEGWTPFAALLPKQPPRPRPKEVRPPPEHISELLTFTLSTDKPRYRQHEPVQVTFTMTNKSDVDVRIYLPGFDRYRAIMSMDCPGGSRSMEQEWCIDEDNPPEVVKLKGGKSVSVTHKVEVAWLGEYRITGEFRGLRSELNPELKWRGELKATPACFSVAASSDARKLLESKLERLVAELRQWQSRRLGDACLFRVQSDIRDIGLEAAPHLIVALRQEKNDLICRRLHGMLGYAANPDALPFYNERLKRGRTEERIWACSGMYELYRRETPVADQAVRSLMRALSDEESAVRRVAASCLARIRHPIVKQRFESAVADEDEAVRSKAGLYVAAYEDRRLDEWFGLAARGPTLPRYVAAQAIIRDLENVWHISRGELPKDPWERVSKDPRELAQFRETLLGWKAWAKENPRSASLIFKRARYAWPGDATSNQRAHVKRRE